MKLKFLCDAAGIRCPQNSYEREIKTVVTDSRTASLDSLFVCMRGLHADGHTYIRDAIQAGACAIVTETDFRCDLPDGTVHLTCNNTWRAAAHLYNAQYGFPAEKMKLIGVTGTNGKTTVTHMLRTIFSEAGYRCGVIGTLGCELEGALLSSHASDSLFNMTTPDPCELYRVLSEMAARGAEYAMMEISSHALALEKVSPLLFEAGIFTNLTPEHLDFHGDMNAYADAKARLFEKSKLAVINFDSFFAEQMEAHAKGRSVTCSLFEIADYIADSISLLPNAVRYRLLSERLQTPVFCPVIGEFNVMNSMQAAVCAIELGIPPQVVASALAAYGGVRGRMEQVFLGESADLTVLIDYAHTPDALKNLLTTASCLKKESGGRLVLLFGCGGERDKSKRALMGKVASELADRIIVTSDNSRGEDPDAIIAQILSGVSPRSNCTVIPSRAEAIEYAVISAQSGDCILLAGKGHEEYEINAFGRQPFCERHFVQEAYRKRLLQNNKNDTTEIGL